MIFSKICLPRYPLPLLHNTYLLQVARALVPVLTMAISMLLFRKDYSGARKWAVLPIVLGVALAFYGDMSYTAIGVFYTAACVVLAALKAVVGGELLTGDLKLNEMDLLNKMCPLALVWIGLAAIGTGEVNTSFLKTVQCAY